MREHAYFDVSLGGVDFGAYLASLEAAEGGDIVLLHGCCHNPTGTTFSTEQWTALAKS